MIRFEGLCRNIFSILMLLTFFVAVRAQQASMATNPSATPFFRSVSLTTGQKQKMDFSVRLVGSVKGRVFNDPSEPQGISGVKVSLHSRDTGFENYVLEQFTDEIGAYSFEDLRPGRYSIEVDPANLPAKFRFTREVESPVEVKPSHSSNVGIPASSSQIIKGIVFIDTNNDGKYDGGKDTPVEGAYIVVDGRLTTSDSNGAYVLDDLRAGRVALLVSRPRRLENTHVVLDLADGPVTNRIVNIPMGH